MENSCLKIPFSILQFTKMAQKAISWSRIHFFGKFEKFVIFACKLLSFRIWHLAYPKLVGTPCTRPVHAPFELQGLALCTKPSDFGHLIFIGTQSQRNFLKSTILTTAYERHRIIVNEFERHLFTIFTCGSPSFSNLKVRFSNSSRIISSTKCQKMVLKGQFWHFNVIFARKQKGFKRIKNKATGCPNMFCM